LDKSRGTNINSHEENYAENGKNMKSRGIGHLDSIGWIGT
jgi:hypothetical protein